MGKQLFKSIGQSIVFVLLAVIIISCLGFTAYLHRDTIVNYKVVLGTVLIISLALGIGISMLIPRRFTDNRILKICFVSVAFFSFFICAFYTLNYYFADSTSIHIVQGIVENKYYEIHHQSKRIGRRSYGQGAPYKVYLMDLTIPELNRTKSIRISYSRYRHLHKGDTLRLDVAKGLFGVPVIKKNEY